MYKPFATNDTNLLLRSKVWAQGTPGTNSKRPSAFIQGVYPAFLDRGHGCYVYDTSGNRYVDFVASLGPLILGHNHPKVNEAILRQLRKGVLFSLPSPLEIEVAEKIVSMFPVEQVRILKTGNEATLAAIRIARAYTAQDPAHENGYFWSEGYHGHGDLWTALTPPAIGVTDEFHVLRSSPDNINKGGIRILEPIQTDASDHRRMVVSDLCAMNHSLIILDEIVTALRVPSFSVAKWWDLKPDMICLGKALAYGLPLSVVAGKKEVMSCDEYFVSSTYSGETLSLAACKAVLEEVYLLGMADLWFYANRFQDKFNELCRGIGVALEGYGTRAMLNVEYENTMLFMQEAVKAGLLFGKAFYYTFAHMEGKIEESTFNLIADIVERIRTGQVKLEGEKAVQTFVR